MTALPAPCPKCGGLVDRQTVRCTRCRAAWSSVKELYLDGLCLSSERAKKIAGSQDWNCLEAVRQGMQDVQEALYLRGKYEIEIEKLERIERR